MATFSGILLSLCVLLLAGCGATPVQAGSVWQNQAPAYGVAHPAPMGAQESNQGPRRAPQPRRTLPPRRPY